MSVTVLSLNTTSKQIELGSSDKPGRELTANKYAFQVENQGSHSGCDGGYTLNDEIQIERNSSLVYLELWVDQMFRGLCAKLVVRKSVS